MGYISYVGRTGRSYVFRAEKVYILRMEMNV